MSPNLELFLVLLAASLTYFNYDEMDPNQRPLGINTTQFLPEYDFIIIGAGSAGNVLANRLTEISNWTVLLLEAGGNENFITDMPILNYNLWFSDADWNYTTAPQQYACQATSGVCTWPRGHILGGSSTLNDFVFTRGNKLDYDNWSNLGNEGWSYDEVLPYFLKAEDNRNPELIGSPYHRQGGYMTISRSPYLTSMTNAYIQAGEEMGYPNIDPNGAAQIGYMVAEGTERNGSRCSTARGYLQPIRNRPNLHISMRSTAYHVHIDPTNRTAVSVYFMRNDKKFIIRVKKEVIVSAGTVNSPQLLMASGVGPAEHLQDVGIPVLQNLRVGDNLHDHVGVPMAFTVSPNITINWISSFENFSAIVDYAKNGQGPLTTLLGVESVAFVHSEPSNTGPVPDTEILFVSYDPLNQNQNIFAAIPFFLHPQSRGTVRLNISNPFFGPPIIDPAYLSHPSDQPSSLNTLRFIADMMQTNTMTNLGVGFNTTAYPLCSNYTIMTDSHLVCLLKYYSVTIYHPVGTCKMGPDSDPTAIVDARLRVHGVKGMRVIDASIIPRIPSSNTNSPTIMIAEKAADLIKQDYDAPITPPPTF